MTGDTRDGNGAPATADPRDAWPAFAEAVRARLDAGAREYGATTLERPLPELADEVMQELEDVSGWAVCLWARVRVLRQKTAAMEQGRGSRGLSATDGPEGRLEPADASMDPVGAAGPSADSSIGGNEQQGDAWALPASVAALAERIGRTLGATPGAVLVLGVRMVADELARRAAPSQPTSLIIIPGRDVP